MELTLSINELRVLGCLIEKQMTTPEYYPLTLSALTNACNQKSNRDPVLSLSESEVLDAIKMLETQFLVREKQLPGSRATKYAHKLTGTLTDQFGFNDREVAILSVLFLRGPQTPGEIRTRTQRSCDFQDVHEVDRVLKELADKKGTPYVKALLRQPGKREIRYCHLLGDINSDSKTESEIEDVSENEGIATISSNQTNETLSLRNEVAQLRAELEVLKSQVNLHADQLNNKN